MSNLFWPMFALVLWTFLISVRNLQVRISSMRSRQVKPSYYEVFRGDASEIVMKTGNNLRNLTEFPPLFYIVIVLIMVFEKADQVFAIMAWAYVAFRVLHSLVHLTFNKVPVRFSMFFISHLLLLAFWLRLALML